MNKQILIILLVAILTTAQYPDSLVNLKTGFINKIITSSINKTSPDGTIIRNLGVNYNFATFYIQSGKLANFPNYEFNLTFNKYQNRYQLSIKNITINTPITQSYFSPTIFTYKDAYVLVNIDILLSFQENGQLELTNQNIQVDYNQINLRTDNENKVKKLLIIEIIAQLNNYVNNMISKTNDELKKQFKLVQFNNIPITFNKLIQQVIQIDDNQSKDFVFQLNVNTLNTITQQIFDNQQLKGIINNPQFPNQIQKAMVGYNDFNIQIRFDQVPKMQITKERIIALADNVVAEIFSGNTRIHKIIMGLKFTFEPSFVENTNIKLELIEGYVVQFATQRSEIKSIDKTIMRNFINTMIINQIPKINEIYFNNNFIPINFTGYKFDDVSIDLIEDFIIIGSNPQV